jgi:hypothetical protein
MYYRISNVIKKILIKELQTLFIDHPVFGDNAITITNKYQFPERPKYAIVVKAASADSIKLSLDNFKGMIKSYTTLANLKGRTGRMIEWVREDVNNIGNIVKPGFYVVEMVEDRKFTVTPYLTVADEVLEIETGGFKQAFLKYKNVNPGSEYILSETARRLQRDVHYSIDYTNGAITFLQPIDDFGELTADYQYITSMTGPFEVEPETANITAIPGVVLAFGNFIKKDGVQVVVVYSSRQDVAKAYLGKWKMTLNFSIVAQDTDTQEQLADLTAMYLWSVLQEKLVDDGIYIDTFSLGGESEEEEVKTSNELSFLADLSCSIEVEWEAIQPVLGVIKRVFLNRIEDFGKYDDPEFASRSTRSFNVSQVGVDYKLGLQPVEDLTPILVRPTPKYTLMGSRTQA